MECHAVRLHVQLMNFDWSYRHTRKLKRILGDISVGCVIITEKVIIFVYNILVRNFEFIFI